MHKPKNVGDNGHPCLTPMLLKKYSEKPFSVFSWHLTCSYNRAIAAQYSNGMPISIILCIPKLTSWYYIKCFLKPTKQE